MKYFPLVLLMSSSAFAHSSGNITISGTIPTATHLVVNSSVGYSNLNLVAGVTNSTVCTVREINNTTAGYTVTLTSSNSGKLKNGIMGIIVYTAKYNGVAVILSNVSQTITYQGSQSSIVNIVKNFSVTLPATPESTVMQGVYTDSLTFTISSN